MPVIDLELTMRVEWLRKAVALMTNVCFGT